MAPPAPEALASCYVKTSELRQYGDPELGKRLRRLRLARGLTQADLAEPNYTHAHVSTIESGRRMPSEEALEFFAQKLGVDTEELATGRPPGIAPELRRELERARLDLSRGHVKQVRPKVQGIRRKAREFNLPRVEARALEIEGLASEQSGDAEAALRCYERAVEVLHNDAPTARAYAIAGQIRCLKALNEPHHAAFVGENYLERLKKLRMTAPAAVLRVESALVLAYFAAGSRSKALTVAEECQKLIRKVNDPSTLAAAYVNVGAIQLESGFHDDANVSFAKAEELFEALELQNESAMALLARGYNYARNNDLKQARKVLEKASPLLAEAGNTSEHANAEMELARLDRLEGDTDSAIARLQMALGLLETKDQPRLQAWAYRELGLALRETDHKAAGRHLDRALQLYESNGVYMEVARTHVLIAKLEPPTSKLRLQAFEKAAEAIEKIPDL